MYLIPWKLPRILDILIWLCCVCVCVCVCVCACVCASERARVHALSCLVMSLLTVKVTQSCPTLYPGIKPRSPTLQVDSLPAQRRLEWVAYPFSSRSSQPRNWTGVSCIAGGFFTNWAMRKAPQFVCRRDKDSSRWGTKNVSYSKWQKNSRLIISILGAEVLGWE